MQNQERLLLVLQESVQALNTQGHFDGGQEFRPTQDQALKAYQTYLFNDNLTTEEKLKGFFEIPTGVGKTAVFVGIVASAMKVMQERGEEFKVAVVVPTTQLLTQTQESFAKFAPDTAEMIGLYGDGIKNADMPITIMTYNAWYDLTVSGEMGSHNIDMMISDEAHRGTSEQRVETILDAYDSNTVQLAFTATAHFDDNKSVYGSHEREIFYKSIGQAIREGELASYVQSQRAVIRVEPSDWMLSDEFQEAKDTEKTRERKKLRQQTWNDYATKIFREGRDERTGDLLTDNQAGFFVDGIAQADHLEKLLNNDPDLRERTLNNDLKGIAVAIHSNLSGSEQKRRLDAYMNGEYLAVIGDEKFKEGFDHPPMKTIIDYPHSSVVDKAQILGRGARKWWNDIKGRFEGLTVIDTVIYIGSPDHTEDIGIRETVLCNAVTVQEILESSYVLSLDAPSKNMSPTRSKDYYDSYGTDTLTSDPNIEYYSKIEELYKLETEVSHLRKEHWFDLSEEMKRHIRNEVERTGFSARKLFEKFENAEIPEDLTLNRLQNILVGNQRSLPLKNWEWIVERFKGLETVDKITITEEMRHHLFEEMKRTGKGEVLLLRGANHVPETVDKSYIQCWKRGIVKTALQESWEWVVAEYASLPSVSEDLNFDKDKKRTISSEFERTQARGNLVINALGENTPEGFNSSVINSLIDGKKKTIRKDFWEATIKGFSLLEDTIVLTDEHVDTLRNEVARTGIKPTNLLKNNTCTPKNLSGTMINTWLNGRIKRAKKIHYDFVIKEYAALDDTKVRVIPVTDAMREHVVAEVSRTGIKGTKLRLGETGDIPTAGQIEGLLNKKLKSIKENHWEWTKKAYAKQESVRVFIDSDKELLKAEMNRTNIGAKKFASLFSDKAPEGFTASTIGNWLRNTKSTSEVYWKFVIDTYASQPTLEQRPRKTTKLKP